MNTHFGTGDDGVFSGPKVEALPREGFHEVLVNNKVFLRDEAGEFHRLTGALIKQGVKRFLINFQDCQYISSEGLGCVAEFWRKCDEGGDIRMAALFKDEPVNELLNFFEMIGLARVMAGHVFKSHAEAAASLRG